MTHGAEPMEINTKFFKLEIDLLYDPVLLLSRHIPKVFMSYFRVLTGCTFIAAVFGIIKKQELTRCTSVNELKMKM